MPAVPVVALGLSLAVAVVGCGVGIGPGPGDGEVVLSVTRDFGRTQVVAPVEVGIGQSDTVMRVLDRSTEIETSYGGRFVNRIDGIENTSDPRSFDWFYFVDGIAAEIGAAEFELESGDSVWWDYRDWTAAMEVGAVTGSYPKPLTGAPVRFSCLAPKAICDLARERLSDDGVETFRAGGSDEGSEVRVEVGPIGRIEALQLDEEPAASGVFARFTAPSGTASRLHVLDGTGAITKSLGRGAGLVAAVKRPGEGPVWIITGTDQQGVAAATSALDPEILDSTYAVVVPPRGGDAIPVPTIDEPSGEA